MSIHLQREMDGLKKRIMMLSALVEEHVLRAVRAVERRDETFAQQIIDTDTEIDMMEIDVEEECLKILALHQPVAVDLRFIVAVLKINNDLERIGDLAVNIAERALDLARRPRLEIQTTFPEMSEKARRMLKNALDSLVTMDRAKAKAICTADDEVDELYRQMYEKVKSAIVENPANTEELLQYLSISRQLERIADHATNIAEDIIYFVDGEIVRHKGIK
jgi:phosphate transport system protein